MVRSLETIRGSDTGYLAFHAPRYQYILELVDTFLPPGGRLLDIGISPLTALLRQHVGVPIDSLGLEAEGPPTGGRHFQYDLNRLGDPVPGAPELSGYDVIVCAEVLEHLYTSPRQILGFLHRSTSAHGHVILQTPNAASLFKRLRLLLGVHPYEMLRETRTNPGHFREYTVAELRAVSADAGFEIVQVDRRYYFDARFAAIDEQGRGLGARPIVGAVKNAVCRALPPFLREGVTLVLGKR